MPPLNRLPALHMTLMTKVWMGVLRGYLLIAVALIGFKVVTVPAQVVDGTGKLAVKGTAAVVRAVVPDDEKPQVQEEPQEPQPSKKGGTISG